MVARLLGVGVRRLATSAVAAKSRYYSPQIANTMESNMRKHLKKMEAVEERMQRRREVRLGAKPEVKNPIIEDTHKTKVFNRQFQVG
jgi:hypothetical protein